MSIRHVYPSVWTSAYNNGAPSEGTGWNLLQETNTKSCPETPGLVKIGQKYWHIIWRPKNVYIADSGTMDFAARQQCKAIHFCISMATLNYWVLLSVTLRPTAIKRVSIVALLLQQLSRKTATFLRHTYITYVFLFKIAHRLKAQRLPLNIFFWETASLLYLIYMENSPIPYNRNYVHNHLPPVSNVRALLETYKLHLGTGEKPEFKCII
jgi:hypothetical protein